jgi:enoyl-CoA hydratase/carnithine racemase
VPDATVEPTPEDRSAEPSDVGLVPDGKPSGDRPGRRGSLWTVSELATETVGHVRVLRLDRPARKNALTSSLGWAIVRAVGEAHHDDDVRVVAVVGNGDAFCSGLDLGGGDGQAADTGLSEQEQELDQQGWVGRFLLALRFRTDKPVVAGVNGVAVGAGLSLALAADIRIAADTARLHPGYLRAGTSPDGGLTWSLPTLVGHERAMRFLLESRFVDADEALRLGIVSEVVPADQLSSRLLELCQAIATQAPLAVRRTKRLVARTPLVTDVEARVVDEIRSALAGLDSEDGKEAVRAIIEKRAPQFRGR